MPAKSTAPANNTAPHHKGLLPISVAMVIHNEEALLERALLSVWDLVDDIVVVHDGPCTDRSLEIAKKYGAHIFVQPHVGAPEPHRPLSFRKAKHNWILQMDADEYLQDDFRQQLQGMIQEDVSGFTVNWMEDNQGTITFNMVKEVLFRKDRVYFIGAPCEYVKPTAGNRPLEHRNVGLVNSAAVSNYASWAKYRRRYGQLATIQAEHYAMPFHEINLWNYAETGWDHNTQLKIDHPILLGVVGMNVKYLLQVVKRLLGFSTATTLTASFHLMWYNTFLYWKLFTLTKRI